MIAAHADVQAAADLFGAVTAPAAAPIAADALMEFRGRLLRNAELRTKPAVDGVHSAPVVCMELHSLVADRTCYAEKRFTDATRRDAERLAKSLTKGRVVVVLAAVADMRVVFQHADSVVLEG